MKIDLIAKAEGRKLESCSHDLSEIPFKIIYLADSSNTLNNFLFQSYHPNKNSIRQKLFSQAMFTILQRVIVKSSCERRAGDFFCIHTVNLQLMWGLWMK